MRAVVGIAAFAVASLVPAAARANSSGVAGYSGKPNINAPAGESCNQCHSGGTAPTLSWMGPTTLAAGQTAEYTLVVSTGASRAAAGIAATDGVVLTPVQNVIDAFGEMVQNAPVAVAGGQATFRFTVKAPASGTTLRLWAVGLAANNNGATSGDRAAHGTRDVTVTGGAPAPADAGSDGSATPGDAGSPLPYEDDAGPGASSSGGDTGGAGASGATPGDADEDDDGATASGASRRISGPGAGNGGSCSSSPLAHDRGPILAVIAAAALAATARRRRPRA